MSPTTPPAVPSSSTIECRTAPAEAGRYAPGRVRPAVAARPGHRRTPFAVAGSFLLLLQSLRVLGPSMGVLIGAVGPSSASSLFRSSSSCCYPLTVVGAEVAAG